MSSPVSVLLLAHIQLDRASDIPLYVQVSNSLTQLITAGKLVAGQKLPGSRVLADLLGIHRKTVNMAFDELLQQGFLESKPQKGTFVAELIPTMNPESLPINEDRRILGKAGFAFHHHEVLQFPYLVHQEGLVIDEGLPDLRLSPIQEIQRTYRNMLSKSYQLKHWSYSSPFGDEWLREEYASYLRSTRGLSIDAEGLIITRGSQMAIYLASALLLKKGSKVAVGHLNYQTANYTLKHHGAELIAIPVDDQGMDTDALKQVCDKEKITAVYVTPHHHHPTTATLSADRRIHLLQLAATYGFAIMEDDYDYDFHFERSPLLPLASADHLGHVLYIGAISKIISPALRIGFLAGPKDFIQSAGYYRRIMDRQGDNIMERTIAQMLANGEIAKHSKKALKIYLERRNVFAQYLDQLSDHVNYRLPDGGMAFWVGVDPNTPLEKLSAAVRARGLELSNWRNYDPQLTYHNHIRMGFASLSPEEMAKAFEILSEELKG